MVKVWLAYPYCRVSNIQKVNCEVAYNIFFFVVYLTLLSIVRAIWHLIIGCLMSNELERIWKEAVIA
jgi:hypothetical protein